MKRLGMTGLALIVAACGNSDGGSRLSLDASPVAPDEFLVVPSKPLELPGDMNTLPAPEPGAANLADINPHADLARALGGSTSGVPRNEAALIAALGPPPDIRQVEQEEERLLDRLFGGTSRPTTGQSIDPFAEADRLRALGIDVPPNPAF